MKKKTGKAKGDEDKIKKDWSYRWMIFAGKVEDFFFNLMRIKRP